MKYRLFGQRAKNRDGVVFDVDSLYAHLEMLEDQRDPHGVRYPLPVALVLVVLAKLAGQDHARGMSEWLKHRQQALVHILNLERPDMPHQTTLSRILGKAVKVEEMEAAVGQFFASHMDTRSNVVVAIDGKTLRGTIGLCEERGVHLLAAYLPEAGVVLMQVEVNSAENEIVVAPKVLDYLDLRGKVVTGDAIFAQRELSIQVVEAGGEYVWAVKGNQAQLKQDIETLFEPEACIAGFSPVKKDFQTARSMDKGHGRLEERSLTTSSLLKGYADWPYLEQVFRVERRVTRLKSGTTTSEVAYGVTSLKAEEAGPEQLLDIVRKHWGIENGLHYRRDESLREDRCRLSTGHAAHMMAIINNLVLGLLLRRGVRNVPQERRRFDAHPSEALALILRC